MLVHSNFIGNTFDFNVIYFDLEEHPLNFIEMNHY
jgi:hypothetical protein